MLKKKTVSLALVIIGILANNYVYLHDLVIDNHDGFISLGWYSWVGIVATLIVIAIGIVNLVRSEASEVAA
jgi:hypothetical protein